MCLKGNEKKKWTNEAILTLIEAYKEEPCLYAVNTPNYHNKHMRSKALKNVCAAVSMLRSGITESECATKFHNVRSQFNIENKKIKLSMKSGTGTNDVNIKPLTALIFLNIVLLFYFCQSLYF